MALEYNDLIQQNPENGKYRVGHEAISAWPSGCVALQLARDLPTVFDARREADERNVAPIKDYTGAMVAAISVAAPSARLSSQKIPTVGSLLVRTTEEISEKLGYEKSIKAKAQ